MQAHFRGQLFILLRRLRPADAACPRPLAVIAREGSSQRSWRCRLYFASLAPVLEALKFLRQTAVWFEVTTLLIPGENDSDSEIHRAAEWFAENLGRNVPWHFTAFHPDFKMLDQPRTPAKTLVRPREIARSKGLNYVYTGNVHDPAGGSTWCPGCGRLLVERDWHELGEWNLAGKECAFCGCEIAGIFEESPGTWGAKRLPVRLSD